MSSLSSLFLPGGAEELLGLLFASLGLMSRRQRPISGGVPEYPLVMSGAKSDLRLCRRMRALMG